MAGRGARNRPPACLKDTDPHCIGGLTDTPATILGNMGVGAPCGLEAPASTSPVPPPAALQVLSYASPAIRRASWPFGQMAW